MAALLAGAAVGPNGWPGPPWLKVGWYHAYLVLRDGAGRSGRGDGPTPSTSGSTAARERAGAQR